MPDELGPAEVGCAEVLAVQSSEADVHQNLAQAVVHCVQDEALRDRAVRRRGGSRLQQPPGAAAPHDFDGRLFRSGDPGGSGCEQLPGRAEQGELFKRGAAEAEGVVVILRGDSRTAWCANGAEVQDTLALIANRSHFPWLNHNIRRLARGGKGHESASFYRGLKGELLVRAVLSLVLIKLSILVLECRSVKGYARVKESIIRTEENGLLVQRVEALFATRPAGLYLWRRFRSLAFY